MCCCQLRQGSQLGHEHACQLQVTRVPRQRMHDGGPAGTHAGSRLGGGFEPGPLTGIWKAPLLCTLLFITDSPSTSSLRLSLPSATQKVNRIHLPEAKPTASTSRPATVHIVCRHAVNAGKAKPACKQPCQPLSAHL